MVAERSVEVEGTNGVYVKTGEAGKALIQSFEQCRLTAYPDPGTGGEPITIGWGHTGGVKLGDTCTQEEADAWFAADLAKFEDCVNDALENETLQRRFDALVSLAYNIGCKAISGSTLIKLMNAGDIEGAASQFGRWNKAGGKVMAGLTRRRQAERDLFLS